MVLRAVCPNNVSYIAKIKDFYILQIRDTLEKIFYQRRKENIKDIWKKIQKKENYSH